MRNRRICKASAARPIRQRGLTLIELLVAITVLAFVAVLGWRGLDSIVRARIALTGDLEQTRGMQLAFAQLQSDCAHLVASSVLPDRVPLAAEPGRLKLVRTVFADNQPSRLQVVTYRVRDGVLTRRESPETRDLGELDMLWQGASGDTDAAQEVVLQSGVSEMNMRLWIGGSIGWRSGAEAAQLTAPPVPPAYSPLGQTTQLPLLTGLEVSMKLTGQNTGLLKIFLLGAV
ncbi:MAG: prepilin-type N-terminal cleavage/methylation domain-containing protein [Nitrosomonadales bacterium]|nr:prepilin-type N-terminal cleavage/methylation domain-containing protein [Nitrosomonadales bacterium]